jgi:hypothetical protein
MFCIENQDSGRIEKKPTGADIELHDLCKKAIICLIRNTRTHLNHFLEKKGP